MDEEKRKIELPRALREIVKILHEEGPMTYEELAEKLEKDETTIIRQVQKLIDMEILVKVEKENKTAVALAEGVEVDDEGNVYVPSPFEDPLEKLKELLEEAGVKGKKLRWILRLVESTPTSLQNPTELYDILVGSGLRRQLAQQIVKAFFGTNVNIPQPPAPGMPPAMRPYNSPYQMNPGMQGFIGHWTPDRELLKLEMKLEKLVEALKEKKSDDKPAFPVVRRVKVDEQGRPVEVIEEPAWMANRNDESTKLLVQVMQQQAKDREEMFKTLFQIQQQTSQMIEKMLQAMQQMQQQMQEQLQKVLLESEKKRVEEQAKWKEELYKKEMEWMRQLYEEKLKEMQETIQGIQRYYEEQTKKVLEELKKEWEWRERLRELEERRGLRDVVVQELKALAEEGRETFKQMREQMREYMEATIKERMRTTGVPPVEDEEKRRIVEALRRATGRAKKPARRQEAVEALEAEAEAGEQAEIPEEDSNITMKIVGGEEQ